METEARIARCEDADGWSTSDALAAMLEGQAGAVVAVRAVLPDLGRAVEAATARLAGEGGGRLVYAGAGASGRIAAQDAAELHPTFGWPHGRAVCLIAGGHRSLARSV